MNKIKVDLKTPIEDQLKELGIVNFINLSSLLDMRPSLPYLVDVDDGKSMCGVSPKDARAQFEKQGRLGLTVREGLAIFRNNPDILKSHNLDLVGSQCYSDYVPYLYRSGGGPTLDCDWEAYASPEWGAPSVGSGSSKLGDLELLEARVSAIEKAWEKKFNEKP